MPLCLLWLHDDPSGQTRQLATMSPNPISVLMPIRDGAAYLRSAVRSLQEQAYTD